MDKPIPYDYYYANEAEQYTFFRIPKALITEERYSILTDSAKILYGLILDRMGLSIKNGWYDEKNRVYIIYKLEDAVEHMNCCNEKGVKLFGELDTKKGVGLIERVKRGQGKPSIIYVRKFFDSSEVKTSEKQKSGMSEEQNSRLRKNRSLDFGESNSSNTNISNINLNQTKMSYTDQSIHQPSQKNSIEKHQHRNIDLIDEMDRYRETIYVNIDYRHLVLHYDADRVDEVVQLMLDTICSMRETERVSGTDVPITVVRKRLLKLRSQHISYVFDCLDQTTKKIDNIRAYMLTALYNSIATIEHYYRTEVNHT